MMLSVIEMLWILLLWASLILGSGPHEEPDLQSLYPPEFRVLDQLPPTYDLVRRSSRTQKLSRRTPVGGFVRHGRANKFGRMEIQLSKVNEKSEGKSEGTVSSSDSKSLQEEDTSRGVCLKDNEVVLHEIQLQAEENVQLAAHYESSHLTLLERMEKTREENLLAAERQKRRQRWQKPLQTALQQMKRAGNGLATEGKEFASEMKHFALYWVPRNPGMAIYGMAVFVCVTMLITMVMPVTQWLVEKSTHQSPITLANLRAIASDPISYLGPPEQTSPSSIAEENFFQTPETLYGWYLVTGQPQQTKNGLGRTLAYFTRQQFHGWTDQQKLEISDAMRKWGKDFARNRKILLKNQESRKAIKDKDNIAIKGSSGRSQERKGPSRRRKNEQ